MASRRRVSACAITLRDFTPLEKLAFIAGWSPRRPWDPSSRPLDCRWTTWDAYLGDWQQVRDELHALQASRGCPTEFFADAALAFRERFGARALEQADYYALRAFEVEQRRGGGHAWPR